MCQIYPSFQSCCGIPSRIALIFIAVLSIVTGALINAMLKRAGINPSTIQADFDRLKKASVNDFTFDEKYDNEVLLESPSTEYIDTTYEDVETTTRTHKRHRSKKTTYGPSTVEIIGEDRHRRRQIIRFTNDDDDDSPNKPEQRPHRNRRFKASHGPSRRHTTTESSNKVRTKKTSAILATAEWPFQDTTQSSEEEIVLPFQETGGGGGKDGGGGGDAPPPPPDQGGGDGGDAPPPVQGGDGGGGDGGDAPPPEQDGGGGGRPPRKPQDYGGGGYGYGNQESTTTPAPVTEKAPIKETKKKETFNVQLMGAVNTTGLNFLGLLFIALGILLLIANFLNSPDLMFLYVVLCISKSIIMLGLLIGVMVQCARARDLCLLRNLDWFTSFSVTIFWFLYSFVWAFFAAVANGYANFGWGNAL